MNRTGISEVAPRGIWTRQWDVLGDNGELYKVSQKEDGSWACSCPHWKFAKKPKPICKHARRVIAIEAPDIEHMLGDVDNSLKVTRTRGASVRPDPIPAPGPVYTTVLVTQTRRRINFSE